MNVLFLNGSPRKNGFTVQLMKYIQEGIGANHSVTWVHACDLDIKPCQSCWRCRPEGECKLPPDEGHAVWHSLRSSDALVIGSPTYFGNISGALKTLIDRSLTAFEAIAASGTEMPVPAHIGQKALMVTACNVPYPISQQPNHAAGALQAMETILKAGGYTITGEIVVDGAAAKKELSTEQQAAAINLGRLLVQA